MGAFDSSFDSAFDSDSGAVVSGTAGFGIEISVVDPLVFDSSAGYIKWYATVRVGDFDVSNRLTGQIKVQGAEESARVMSLSVIPATVLELESYESAPITLDVTLFRTGQAATFRRFTGLVESVTFAPAERVATLSCRDGYQERPAACASAAEVEALLGGMAVTCPALVAWSDSEPDPAGYFNSLLDTLAGTVAIDSSGLWRAVPWSIGTPDATFGPGEVFADSVSVSRPTRAETPSAIVATLNHRFPRLHAAEKVLSWTAVDRTRYVVDGVPTLPKQTAIAAIQGISNWIIKGKPVITQPVPGAYPVIVGPQTTYYLVSYDMAQYTCQSLSVTLYRRWYQEVEVAYSVTIDMGGASDRDDSISASIQSTFDGSAWETTPTTSASTGLYQANEPTPLVGAPVKTGYEGLSQPWPPANGSIDHYADLTGGDIDAAVRHVVARAVRKASLGKRKQTVTFARPADPRFEIGAVLGMSAYGVTATGQLVDFDDTLDHDTGAAYSTFTLACPSGTGPVTNFTAVRSEPVNAVTHLLTMPALGNHIGAHLDTPARPDEDQLLGFLCNTIPTSDNYDPAAPVYEPQFRIVMPEIPAEDRDPLTIPAPIAVTVSIAGSGLEVTF